MHDVLVRTNIVDEIAIWCGLRRRPDVLSNRHWATIGGTGFGAFLYLCVPGALLKTAIISDLGTDIEWEHWF
jgi:hypothetical protein